MNTTLKKFITYFAGIMVSLFILLTVTHIFVKQDSGVFFFSAFYIAIISGFLGSLIYLITDRDRFTYFVTLVSYVSFNALFIYLGPVSLDRSLSSFIYFYSVERGEISRNIFGEEYFKPYIERRFQDGIKIGYLKCDDKICRPTQKTKLTYKFLYPISKFSNVINNYNDFKKYMDTK